MSELEIQLIPCLKDNYAYAIQDQSSGKTAIIDPSEPSPVMQFLEQKKWRLDYIINTHHHWDHTGGNIAIKEQTKCKIVGPKSDEHRIPGIDITCSDGEPFMLGNSKSIAMHIPGHTLGHTAFWFPDSKALFCGDTLFTLGCGFLFEGTPKQMWTSLNRLRELPGSTRVFCGHEYTIENAEFALHIDPKNKALQKYVKRANELRNKNEPTVPSLMKDELAANPFLRVDNSSLQQKLSMEGYELFEIFAKIRALKNEFDKRN